jgi:protein-S-isoprenylcysteine O-methyltransferase Ste14
MEFIYTRNVPLIIIAGVVLFLQLPVPLYWFVLHPNAPAWRRHKLAAYITAVLFAWGLGTIFLFLTRQRLYAPTASLPRALAGCALIFADLYLFRRSAKDLGYKRLVGESELSGGGEMTDGGIYTRIRNPRYAGSFLAIIGACLIAGTRWMWLTTAIWAALMFAAIVLEEREMRGRFGAAYIDYCRRVPRFLPSFLSPFLSKAPRHSLRQ